MHSIRQIKLQRDSIPDMRRTESKVWWATLWKIPGEGWDGIMLPNFTYYISPLLMIISIIHIVGQLATIENA